jgi:diacylglycerol kinase family enzyme
LVAILAVPFNSEAQMTPSSWHAADPSQQPVLFLNPKSGGGKAVRAGLAERAREKGIEVIVVSPDRALAALVDEAVSRGADSLGVAGGDGSLAVVSAAAVTHGLPFVCVPAGTRNHFALDLGIDRHDLVGSLDAFTDGVERRIDIAEVNGRLFLNNVSLGVYGDAVRQPTYRDAKARTLLETAAHVLGPSAAAVDLQLVDDRGRVHRTPAVVLVSNNPYSLEPPRAPGTRPTLCSGRLGVVVLGTPGAGSSPGSSWTATQIEVNAPAPVHAGIDGEAVDLTPPLRFVILPGALRVRIPSRQATG